MSAARDAYDTYAYRIGREEPWERLSDTEQAAWREVVDELPEPQPYELAECHCGANKQCPQCNPELDPECPDCGEELECLNEKCVSNTTVSDTPKTPAESPA